MAAELLFYIAGVFIGSFLTAFYILRKCSGTLKINGIDPEKDVYTIEIDDLDALTSKKHIWLRVDAKLDKSQK